MSYLEGALKPPLLRKIASGTWACIGKYGWVFGPTFQEAYNRWLRVMNCLTNRQ